jgi:hypothetical protein
MVNMLVIEFWIYFVLQDKNYLVFFLLLYEQRKNILKNKGTPLFTLPMK